jgi:hypothetical protein
MNATERRQRYQIQVSGLPEARVVGNAQLELGPAEARWVPLAVQVPPGTADRAGPGAHAIRFEIVRLAADGEAPAAVAEPSTFVIPR